MLSSKRNHITVLLQMLFVVCTFTSCMNDDFVDSRGLSGIGEPRYLGIHFKFDSDTSSTRAGEDPKFEDGTDQEHEIGSSGNVVMLFNTKDKQLIGIYDLSSRNKENEDDDYIEAEYLYVIRLSDGDEWEDDFEVSCLVVLNASKEIYSQLKAYEVKNDATIDDILKKIWDETGKDGNPKNIGFSDSDHKYFTMTNSAYYDEENNEIHIAEKFIAKDHIYGTVAEAKNDPIKVYVERMVAKFSLKNEHKNNYTEKYPENETDPDLVFYPALDHGLDPLIFFEGFNEDGSIKYVAAHNWRIRVTGWGINALETENHIFKQIEANGSYFNNWNYPNDYYRSFWSKDPHYGNKDKYPWQYRWAVEKKDIDYYKQGRSPLLNYPYNDFVDQTYPIGSGVNGRKDEFNRVEYVPENTYGQEVIEEDLDARTNLLAGTHLIVCAQLEVDLNDNGEFVPQDWYRDRSGIFYKSEKDCFLSFAHSFNQLLRSQESMKYPLYDWKNGGHKYDIEDWIAKPNKGNDVEKNGMVYILHYENDALTDYRLKELMNLTPEQFLKQFGKLKTADILYGDGKIQPWFEGEDDKLLLTIKTYSDDNGNSGTDNLNIYGKDDDSKMGSNGLVEEIIPGEQRPEIYGGPAATDDDMKSLLFEWLGAIDHFTGGRMYYAVPVLHNGANRSKKDQNQKTLGDYGVVRNNWYKFNLTDIINIGTPVDNPEDPIVPNHVDINDVINFTIKIIDWHPFQWDVPIL